MDRDEVLRRTVTEAFRSICMVGTTPFTGGAPGTGWLTMAEKVSERSFTEGYSGR